MKLLKNSVYDQSWLTPGTGKELSVPTPSIRLHLIFAFKMPCLYVIQCDVADLYFGGCENIF